MLALWFLLASGALSGVTAGHRGSISTLYSSDVSDSGPKVVSNGGPEVASNGGPDVVSGGGLQRLLVSNDLDAGFDSEQQRFVSTPVNIAGFTWSDCGTRNDTIKVKYLVLPKIIDLKKMITISADVQLSRSLLAPLRVVMEIHVYVIDWWVRVPCVEGLYGSCDIADVCRILPSSDPCPPIFSENNLPCHCPFAAKEYVLRNATVDPSWLPIPSELVVHSSFKARVQLLQADQQLACYDLAWKIV